VTYAAPSCGDVTTGTSNRGQVSIQDKEIKCLILLQRYLIRHPHILIRARLSITWLFDYTAQTPVLTERRRVVFHILTVACTTKEQNP